MTAAQILSELDSLGTEQNRKVYAKHGAPENCYGVSFANLEKLRKRIGKNHAVAQQLWFTGNFDACNLATMVAEPAAMTASDLNAWMRVNHNATCDLFARNVVAKSAFAIEMLEEWATSADEQVAAAAFATLSVVAMENRTLPDEYFAAWLDRIESSIHSAQNRVRHSMNNAVIAIGGRTAGLQKSALAAAGRIGKVEVDHGDTACKTPDAAAYIRKTAARAATKKKAAGR
jgi:3-methyladenine DNA glycosylase AlkD